jgi:hypothetical protein
MSPVADPSPPGTEPTPTGRRNAHLRKTAFDMLRSMVVVLALVFVIVLLAWRPLPEEVRVIDPVPVIDAAALQADFTVLAPEGLEDRWRPTSARWEPTEQSGDLPVLHVGYVTPSDQYAQISQSREASEGYLNEQTSGGAPVGTREVGGTVWQQWEAPDRLSLVQIDGGVTTIVSGTGDIAELESLARVLAPAG